MSVSKTIFTDILKNKMLFVVGMMVKTVFGLGEHVTIQVSFDLCWDISQ